MTFTSTYYTRGLFLAFISLTSVLFKVQAQDSNQLSLDACVQKMVRCDVNIKSLENLELISRLNKRIQQTGLFPSMTANGSFNQYIQNSSISYNDNLLPTSTILDARSTMLAGSATASLNITEFGRSIYAVRAAHFENKDQQLETIQLKNQLILQVADFYTNCIISQLTVDQLYNRVEDSKKLLEIAGTKLNSGAADSSEYLTALVNLENDKISFQEASLSLTQLKENFLVLLELPIEQGFSFQSLKETEERISHIPLSGENIASSLDIQRANYQLKQSINQKRSTYFNLFPSITFFGGYSLSDQRFQNGIFAQNKAFGPTYGLAVSYSFGQVKNAIHQSRIFALTSENLSLELKKRSAEKEAEQRHLQRSSDHLDGAHESRLKIAKASRSALKQIQLRYTTGKITINDVRNGQNQLLVAEIALIQSLRNKILNRLTRAGDNTDLELFISSQ